MYKFIFMIFAALFTSACSMTLPVSGTSSNVNEVFTGTATGYLSGNGDLKITSNMGRTCFGDFKYVGGFKKGLGAVNCTDGAQADFVFTSTGTTGIGYAKMPDGTLAQFLFGERPEYSSVPWSEAMEIYSVLSAQMASDVFYCDKYPKTLKCRF